MTTEEKKKPMRPDFPKWLETESGQNCLKWPISEVKYLHNRLFWAFDAGRNCVWDQYMHHKAEHERAQQELQAYRDIIKELIPIAEYTFNSMSKHEVIFVPNKLSENEVAEILDKADKLINTVTPI